MKLSLLQNKLNIGYIFNIEYWLILTEFYKFI